MFTIPYWLRWGAPLLLITAAFWFTDHRARRQQAAADQLIIERLQVSIRTKTIEAENADLRHARAIDSAQDSISHEISRDYGQRITALRARYDSLRAASKGSAGCGGAETLPGISDPTGGADAAAPADRFPCAAALTATEQAMQLEALQNWLREQQKVER